MLSSWSVLIGARQFAKGRRISRADDKLLRRITSEHFAAGYTILEAHGGWFDPETRRFVREDSRQILITSNSALGVYRWAHALGAALRQKEILLVRVGPTRTVKIRAHAR